MVDILRKIGKWNNKPLPDDFTLVVTEQNTTTNKKMGVIDLFRDGRLAKQSLQQFYMWLVIAMGYYGLFMAASDLGGDFYANFIYLNLADVPGLFATMYLTDRVGRKWPTLCSLLIGGTFCIGVGITPANAHTMRVILGNLGKFCLCVAFDGVYTWTVELYPTEVRSVGMGLTAVAGRVGSTAAPWIAQGLKPIAGWLPFVVLGVPAVLGFFLGLSLPETKKKNSSIAPATELRSSPEGKEELDRIEK